MTDRREKLAAAGFYRDESAPPYYHERTMARREKVMWKWVTLQAIALVLGLAMIASHGVAEGLVTGFALVVLVDINSLLGLINIKLSPGQAAPLSGFHMSSRGEPTP